MLSVYGASGPREVPLLTPSTRLGTPLRPDVYEVRRLIHGGSFGVLYEVEKKPRTSIPPPAAVAAGATGQPPALEGGAVMTSAPCLLAIKVMKGEASTARAAWAYEAGVMRVVAKGECPYLAELVDFFCDDATGRPCIVMPRYQTSLEDVLRDPTVVGLSVTLLHRWALQMAQALVVLHKQDIVHADLELRNVFLNGTDIVIGDFGVSLPLDKARQLVSIGAAPSRRTLSQASSPPEARRLVAAVEKELHQLPIPQSSRNGTMNGIEAEIYSAVVTTAADVWAWGYCVVCLLAAENVTADRLDALASLPTADRESRVDGTILRTFGPGPPASNPVSLTYNEERRRRASLCKAVALAIALGQRGPASALADELAPPPPIVTRLPPMRAGLVPRENKLEEIKAALCSQSRVVSVTSDMHVKRVATVLGMGGVGKTTLARQALEDTEVRARFPDGVVWVTLGREVTDSTIALRQSFVHKELLGQTREFKSSEEGKHVLEGLLSSKACLLVVDDVWEARHLDALDVLGPRGVLLFTSRAQNLCRSAHPIKVDHLRDHRGTVTRAMLLGSASPHTGEQSPELSQDPLPEAALRLLDICKGLPLAIVIVGSLRRLGSTWEDVLMSVQANGRGEELVFQSGDERDAGYPAHEGLHAALAASVQHLESSSNLWDRKAASLLSFYAAWQEDTWVDITTAWRVWGLRNEHEGRRVLDCLSSRSLVEVDGKEGRSLAHDLLRDYLRDREGAECMTRRHVETIIRGCAEIGLTMIPPDSGEEWPSPYFDDVSFWYHVERCGTSAVQDATLQKWWANVRRLCYACFRSPAKLRMLTDVLYKCTGLLNLDLAGNVIGDHGGRWLGKALVNCKALQRLYLARNQLGNEGAVALGEALRECTAIQYLDLSSNCIGTSGARVLGEALQQAGGFKVLYLFNNRICVAQMLGELLQHCMALQYLDLSGNDPAEEEAADLSSNENLTVDPAEEAPQHYCASLNVIDLSGTSIGRAGATVLGEVLRHCTALCRLHLVSTGIGDDEARTLAQALQHCTALEEVNLSSNSVGDEGARMLGGALQRCTALKHLALANNAIGADGAGVLAEALQSHIDTLDLSNNPIDHSEARALGLTHSTAAPIEPANRPPRIEDGEEPPGWGVAG